MVLRNYPLKIVPLISLSLSSGISLVAFGQFHHGVVNASHGRPLLFQCKMHDICQPLYSFLNIFFSKIVYNPLCLFPLLPPPGLWPNIQTNGMLHWRNEPILAPKPGMFHASKALWTWAATTPSAWSEDLRPDLNQVSIKNRGCLCGFLWQFGSLRIQSIP